MVPLTSLPPPPRHFSSSHNLAPLPFCTLYPKIALFWFPIQSSYKGAQQGRGPLECVCHVLADFAMRANEELTHLNTADLHCLTHGELGYNFTKLGSGRGGIQTSIHLLQSRLLYYDTREREKEQLVSCSSRCCLQTSSLSFTWELGRNVGSQTPLQTYWKETCILTRYQVISMPIKV